MLTRIAKYSLKNILRNKFLSFSSVLVLTLLMFFINILVILHDVSFKLIDNINSKLTISLYLDDLYDENTVEVITLMDNIKKIGGIGIDYKTKEDILAEIGEREPDLVKILERSNPLPNTIVLSNIKLDQYTELNKVIENQLTILSKNSDDLSHFSNYNTQYDKINKIINILDILQFGLYIIISIFLISISIIIYSIIGNFIYFYKDEIYITRLVGGSKQFIYGPFVIQGSIYSFISYIFSLFIFLIILGKLNTTFGDLYYFASPTGLYLLEVILFVFIGGLAGYFSSKKYLK